MPATSFGLREEEEVAGVAGMAMGSVEQAQTKERRQARLVGWSERAEEGSGRELTDGQPWLRSGEEEGLEGEGERSGQDVQRGRGGRAYHPTSAGEKIWRGGAWRARAARVFDSAPARGGGGAVEVGDDARWAGPPL